ncbi:MAG: hypothetical protein ACK53Y_17520 [bacterium]
MAAAAPRAPRPPCPQPAARPPTRPAAGACPIAGACATLAAIAVCN